MSALQTALAIPTLIAGIASFVGLQPSLHPQAVETLKQGTAVTVHLLPSELATDGDASFQEFEYEVQKTGAIYVFGTSTELIPVVRVLSSVADTLAEGTTIAGPSTSFARLEVTAGDSVIIVVSPLESSSAGAVDLLLREVQINSADLEEARGALAEAKLLKAKGLLQETRDAWSDALVATLYSADPELAEEAVRLLWELGSYAYTDLQDMRQAVTAFQAVLQWRRQFLPVGHPDTTDAMKNVGGLVGALGDPTAALVILEEALEVLSSQQDEDNTQLQEVRLNMAVMFFRLGRLVDADALFGAVHGVYSRLLEDDDPKLQMIRQNYGASRFELGDTETAARLFSEAIEITEKQRPEDDAGLLGMRSNLARVKYRRGDLLGALELDETIYATLRRTRLASDADFLRVSQNLALSRKAQGDLMGALLLQERVYEERSKAFPAGNREVLLALKAIGITRRDLGDVEGAHAIFLEVYGAFLEIDREDSLSLQSARNDLAVSLNDLHRYDEARVLQEQVLAARLRLLPAQDPAVLLARMNLAGCLYDEGRHAEARAIMEEVYAIELEVYGENDLRLQGTRQRLAMGRFSAGDLEGALELEEQVYEVLNASLEHHHPKLMDARLNLAVKISGYRDTKRGRELILEALDGHRIRMGSLATTFGVRALEQANREVFRLLDVLLSIRSDAESASEIQQQELTALMTFRGLNDRQARLGTALSHASKNEVGLRALLTDAQASRVRFIRTLESGGADSELRREMEANEEALLRRARELPESRLLLESPSLAEVARNLPAHSAAIVTASYSRLPLTGDQTVNADDGGELAITCFILSPDGAVVRLELEQADTIAEQCRAFRDSIWTTRYKSNAERPGTELNSLLAPIFAALPAGTKRLYINPERALASIPWDALPMANGELLCDDYTISYIENLAALLPRPALSAAPTLLVCGGVDYEGQPQLDDDAELTRGNTADVMSSLTWENLPSSRVEAEAVLESHAKGFAEAKSVFLSGSQASRSAFRKAAPAANYIHLATHGYLAPEEYWSMGEGSFRHLEGAQKIGLYRGLLSGVVFAGANRSDELGGAAAILSSFELAGLDLARCQLATLSACETNLGPKYVGEGVSGLNRALQLAGARNTITSLWKVPDQETEEFFTAFYDALWGEQMPLVEAFASAQSRMRRMRHSPHQWAGFVLYTTGG
ncbi:MAG: CHAT domain-containing protein [Planctomycetota bacterium]|jgi:CHAT domain-containing protein